MADSLRFQDYDDAKVYAEAQSSAVDPKTKNFVLEFGGEKARILFDVDEKGFTKLLSDSREPTTPVRWINIWAPHTQRNSVTAIAEHYGFSGRLTAILRTGPNHSSEHNPTTINSPVNGPSTSDIEMGYGSNGDENNIQGQATKELNHYDLAKNLINYQSFDTTNKFMSVGANWLHHLVSKTQFLDEKDLTVEKRLWSWLVICDDNTVISFHEPHHLATVTSSSLTEVRSHTLNVFRQLSNRGQSPGLSLSLISVRKNLDDHDRMEGASNLFYYLFDDWQATYKKLTEDFQKELKNISEKILSGLDGRSRHQNGGEIIKKLYQIGVQLRLNQHLYKGYKNLVGRVLRPLNNERVALGSSTPGQFMPVDHVTLATSAMNRFERLSDRIELIMLSSIDQLISEKEELLNTYFNITAQIDSQATAKLNKNAAILSKLGVMFLPVSLMTSYFSVQIEDLQGVYTHTTYWACFAIFMGVSILAMFFLNSLLLKISDKFIHTTKHVGKSFFLKRKQI